MRKTALKLHQLQVYVLKNKENYMKIVSQVMPNQNNQTASSSSGDKTEKTDFASVFSELEKDFRENPCVDKEKKEEEEEFRRQIKDLENSLKTNSSNTKA